MPPKKDNKTKSEKKRVPVPTKKDDKEEKKEPVVELPICWFFFRCVVEGFGGGGYVLLLPKQWVIKNRSTSRDTREGY